jgi:hypothetical protein
MRAHGLHGHPQRAEQADLQYAAQQRPAAVQQAPENLRPQDRHGGHL